MSDNKSRRQSRILFGIVFSVFIREERSGGQTELLHVYFTTPSRTSEHPREAGQVYLRVKPLAVIPRVLKG